MFGPKETIDTLLTIMNEWHSLPKKNCIQKVLGWSEEETVDFLKEYKKEEKKKNKQLKSEILVGKMSVTASNCGKPDCCSN